MDMQKLREEIELDEGVVNKIYLDHLGYPTFGIGHLVKDTDPEKGLPVDAQSLRRELRRLSNKI